jgi:hypothetical protein
VCYSDLLSYSHARSDPSANTDTDTSADPKAYACSDSRSNAVADTRARANATIFYSKGVTSASAAIFKARRA